MVQAPVFFHLPALECLDVTTSLLVIVISVSINVILFQQKGPRQRQTAGSNGVRID